MSAANGNSLHCQVGQCEDCAGTGWYGDNGPGIPGNAEFVRCDCGTETKCTAGWHKYRVIDGIPWCDECGLEADLSVCKLTHPMPNEKITASEAVFGFATWLTCREEAITLGSEHNATPVIELATRWCETNNLTPPREGIYPSNITHPEPIADSALTGGNTSRK